MSKYVNTSLLNLRATATKTGKIVVRLTEGTKVEVIATKGDWSQVTTTMSGTPYTGWVATQYLDDPKPAAVAVAERPWIATAKKYLGLKEVPGTKNNPTIVSWWSKIGAAFRDDETPWCAGFVGGVLEESGIRSSRSAAARSYAKWGTEINQPAYGAIVVFWRTSPSSGNGHVGFVVGKDDKGNLMVLGGNQSDMVSIRAFDTTRLVGYRFPTGYTPTYDLPVYKNGVISTKED